MTAADLRVTHVIAPARFGGLERVVEMLVVGLGDRLPVQVIAHVDSTNHPVVDRLRARGVSVHPIYGGRLTHLRERRAVRRLLAGDRPGILHTHGYRADVLVGTLGHGLGLPSVSTVHGFTGGDLKNRTYEALQIRALRRFAAVVCVSRPLQDRLRRDGVPAERLHVIPNAWAPHGSAMDRSAAREALGITGHGFVVGWVGRLTHEKGPDVFLHAVSQLTDQALAPVLVGAGRERPRLEVLARRLGIADRLRWTGMVPEAGRALAALDCLVLSSRTEGTPIVLFEAMATGIPIVATQVGGVPDVVSAREALLVPPNDPGAIAGAVRAVRDDPAAARRRAAAAADRLRRAYAPGPWLDAYEGMYRDVVAGARP